MSLLYCHFCNRRKNAYFKIICADQDWEYAACRIHAEYLERKADHELGKPGHMRDHRWSTSPMIKEL